MRRLALTAVVFVLAAGLGACAPASKPGAPVRPDAPRLETPSDAVRSYLDWVSYAYRVADSEPASATMTTAELVRIDAYIALNRQSNRGIEQQLVAFEQRAIESGETTALVAASERWEYRYFTLTPLAYATSLTTESYETTYTVVRSDGRWQVDDVVVSTVGTSTPDTTK